MEQGFLHKAVTVYKSVLKLTPGLPHVRERLAETYRQLGMVADALRELELAADELQQTGRPSEALPRAAQDRRAAPRQRRVAHPAGRDGVAGRRRSTRRSTSFDRPAVQLKAQGRDGRVRARRRAPAVPPARRLRGRARAGGGLHRRASNPRLALAKLQGAAEGGAARSAERHAAGARRWRSSIRRKAMSVWRELAEIHDAAGRPDDRDAAMRAALALDPHRRRRRGSWRRAGASRSARRRGRAAADARRRCRRSPAAPGRCRADGLAAADRSGAVTRAGGLPGDVAVGGSRG